MAAVSVAVRGVIRATGGPKRAPMLAESRTMRARTMTLADPPSKRVAVERMIGGTTGGDAAAISDAPDRVSSATAVRMSMPIGG